MRAHRFVVLLLPLLLAAQSLQKFEKKVTEFTLANGLHFIAVERQEVPVVSVSTSVNAGSVDDPSGATGIAHMFEHIASLSFWCRCCWRRRACKSSRKKSQSLRSPMACTSSSWSGMRRSEERRVGKECRAR